MVSVPRSPNQPLSGWGLHPVEQCVVYRPERIDQLTSIVNSAEERSLISRGQGRSYGDASLNRGEGVVLHERLNRFLAFDPDDGVLHCEAAVTFAEIIDHMLPRGFFLPITPGTKHISVGGAIAADVHGKNHHRDGTVSTQIIDFSLLTGTGEILTCSRDENTELFWATLGGMGLTGAILDARIKLRPVENAYVHSETRLCKNLDDALDQIIEGDGDFDYAVAWIDCLARGRKLGRSVLFRANPAALEDLPPEAKASPLSISSSSLLQVPFPLPSLALNSVNMKIFNTVFNAVHRNGHAIANYESFFYPLDAVHNWNNVYGKRGVIQYQIVLPFEHCREGLVEILERIAATGSASFLAVLKGTGPANQGLLSFPLRGASLALDFPNTGDRIFALLATLDEIVLRYGGRTYLAKDCCMRPEHFQAMYPQLERFREIKAKYDPNQRFSSSLARRLGIVEGA